MGFLFGLLIGGMVLGGSGSQQHMMTALGSIPMRCLVAFDHGKEAYRNCRRPALALEYVQIYINTSESRSGLTSNTLKDEIETAMNLEIEGLQQIKDALEARTKSK